MDTLHSRLNDFDQSDCPFKSGETVDDSGLYEVCHFDEPRTRVILTLHQVFPCCRTCGDRVRYKLLQAVPHISEDPDFNELAIGAYNLSDNSTAPKRVPPQQLGQAHGFRFWQDNI